MCSERRNGGKTNEIETICCGRLWKSSVYKWQICHVFFFIDTCNFILFYMHCIVTLNKLFSRTNYMCMQICRYSEFVWVKSECQSTDFWLNQIKYHCNWLNCYIVFTHMWNCFPLINGIMLLIIINRPLEMTICWKVYQNNFSSCTVTLTSYCCERLNDEYVWFFSTKKRIIFYCFFL